MKMMETVTVTQEEHLLDWHLRNWADWMRSGDGNLGYPHAACGCRGNGFHGDFDGLLEESDRTCAIALNAAIDDLPPIETAAIYHTYLYAVYRFPRGALDAALTRARAALVTKMNRKGLWWGGA